MLNSHIKGQPAISGGRRPGDAISRGVCLCCIQFYKVVNMRRARLTKELEAQFEESKKLEEQIRANLKRLSQ
jgi:hypothetical protein